MVPEHAAVGGQPVLVERAGDAEVGDLGRALLVDQDVLGLDVAVDDPARVGARRARARSRSRRRSPRRPAAGPCRRMRSLSVSPSTYSKTMYGPAVVLAGVDDADDVRVARAARPRAPRGGSARAGRSRAAISRCISLIATGARASCRRRGRPSTSRRCRSGRRAGSGRSAGCRRACSCSAPSLWPSSMEGRGHLAGAAIPRAASCSRRRSSARSFALASSITSKSQARRPSRAGSARSRSGRSGRRGRAAAAGPSERSTRRPTFLRFAPPAPSWAWSSGSSASRRPARWRARARSASRSGMPSGSLQWWCRMSQTTRSPVRLVQVEDVAERVGAVVVLDHQPRARALRQPLEAAREAVHARVAAARRAADVQDDDGLAARGPSRRAAAAWSSRSRIARVAHGRVLGVEDDVLARVGREPDARARARARRTPRAPRAHSSTWPWNCGRSGWVA